MPEIFSPAERELLAVVLDRLVPAARGFPAAGALGIMGRTARRSPTDIPSIPS